MCKENDEHKGCEEKLERTRNWLKERINNCYLGSQNDLVRCHTYEEVLKKLNE